MALKLDGMTLLEATERNGALRRLVRVAHVSGITSSDWDILTQALNEAGIPQFGDVLSTVAEDKGGQDMVLVERNPKILSKTHAEIHLVYENFADIEENLDNPVAIRILANMRVNLNQKSTNLDGDGKQVTVSYTYASIPGHDDGLVTQGVEFSYYEPQRTMFVRGIKQTGAPWLIANNCIGKTNIKWFALEEPGMWLCMACDWKLAHRNTSSGREIEYYMNFEFQFNPDGWDPSVTFIDEVTGKPPPNLIEGTGYKTVTKYKRADFEDQIGAKFQGG